MNKSADIVSGALLTILSLVGLCYSLLLPQGVTEMGIPKSGVLPLVVSTGLLCCSLALLGKSYMSLKKEHAAFSLPFGSLRGNKTMMLIILIFVYFAAVGLLGYLIGTFIFVVAALRFLFGHKLLFSAAASSAIVIVTYVTFRNLLEIRLPQGMLF